MKVIQISEVIPQLAGLLDVSYNNITLIPSNFVENYFYKKFGSWYSINSDSSGFLSDFNYYNYTKSEDLNRMLEAYYSDYKPLENYNGKETVTQIYGEQNETYIDGERQDSNTIGNERSTSTDSVTSFDTTDFSETGRNITENNARTDNSIKGVQTNTKNSNEYTNTIITEKSGNLGVTTSQQMIESEIDMRLKNNIKEKYLDMFIAEWCYLVD